MRWDDINPSPTRSNPSPRRWDPSPRAAGAMATGPAAVRCNVGNVAMPGGSPWRRGVQASPRAEQDAERARYGRARDGLSGRAARRVVPRPDLGRSSGSKGREHSRPGSRWVRGHEGQPRLEAGRGPRRDTIATVGCGRSIRPSARVRGPLRALSRRSLRSKRSQPLWSPGTADTASGTDANSFPTDERAASSPRRRRQG